MINGVWGGEKREEADKLTLATRIRKPKIQAHNEQKKKKHRKLEIK